MNHKIYFLPANHYVRRVNMSNRLLFLGVIVSFLIIGCATTQSEQKVERTKKVDVDTVISKLSHQISSTMLEQNKRRVAVMNFTLQTGEMTELGLYLSDKLTNSLFQYRDKFEVVERTRLESVLKEMKLGLTGIIDDKTVQSIGKVLGADAIVIGSITDLGGEVDINIRMLGTERANVLAVASALLEKSDAIVKLMGSVQITEPGAAKTPAPKTGATTPPQPKAMPKVVANDFTFEARDCKWYGERVLCNIVIVNNLQETRRIGVTLNYGVVAYSRLIDNFGNQHRAEELIFGGQRAPYGGGFGDIYQDAPHNLPMNFTLIFRGVSPNASSVSTIILCGAYNSSGYNIGLEKQFQAVLRNIPLTK